MSDFEKWINDYIDKLGHLPSASEIWSAAAEACAKACENIESGRMTATKRCAEACRALKEKA